MNKVLFREAIRYYALKLLLFNVILTFNTACSWISDEKFNHQNAQLFLKTILYTDIDDSMTGLFKPGIAVGILPDGNALVAEQNGYIHLIQEIYQDPKLLETPVAVLENISVNDGGLLGIAIHPDFNNNRLFYLCATVRENQLLVNKIELWKLSPDNRRAKKHSIVMSKIIDLNEPENVNANKDQEGMWFVVNPEGPNQLVARGI
jgi:glucose/arabinose dehydrogenase